MRRLDQLAAIGDRLAPGLWSLFCILLCLALIGDLVWSRSLPVLISALGPFWLVAGSIGWLITAKQLRKSGHNPVRWFVALPFVVISFATWSTVWYLKHPGAAFVSDTLLWIGFGYGFAFVLTALFTVRWLQRQLEWSKRIFWGLGSLALIPVWQFGIFFSEFLSSYYGEFDPHVMVKFLGVELKTNSDMAVFWAKTRYQIARLGLIPIFLSGLAWSIWMVDFHSRRIQKTRRKEEGGYRLKASSTELEDILVNPDSREVNATDIEPDSFRPCTSTEEHLDAKRIMILLAALAGIWAVCPIYVFEKLAFPTYEILIGNNFPGGPGVMELKILAAYPVLLCICLITFIAKPFREKRVEQGSLYILVTTLPVLAIISIMAGIPEIDAFIGSNGDSTRLLIISSLGWVGLVGGGLVRYYRPENRCGYVMALLGSVCMLFSWLLPINGFVPLTAIIQIWWISEEIISPLQKSIITAGGIIVFGLQMAAAVSTFVALPFRDFQRQSKAGLRALLCQVGSLVFVLLGVTIGAFYFYFSSDNSGGFLTILTILIIGITSIVIISFIIPAAMANVVIGLHDKPLFVSKKSNVTHAVVCNTQPFRSVFIMALLFGPLGLDRFFTRRPMLGIVKLVFLGGIAAAFCWLMTGVANNAGVKSVYEFGLFIVDLPFEAFNGDKSSMAIMCVGVLLLLGCLIDVFLLIAGRYRDGNGQSVVVSPWCPSGQSEKGPLEAMNDSLTQGQRHIANPIDLDAWYYGRAHQKLKQSLNTTVSYTLAFCFIGLLLMLLPGCRDIYEMPAGGGEPQLKRQKVVVQKVKKKVFVVNPFSAVLFNPDFERIQLKLEELTKHLYEVGQGKGKGAGFAGGTRRGLVRFIRLKYSSGDWDQDKELNSDLNMLTWYAANTGHKTAKKPEERTIRQLASFPVGKSPPFVYLTGQRSLSLSRTEIEVLREYITTKHGMLFADNGGSSTWHSQFFSVMRQVLPRTEPRVVPLDHPVHDGIPFLPIVAPHGGRTAYMWVVENRIVAYYHPGDIGDAWADGHAGVPRPVWEACYRLGSNIMLYSHSEYSKWLQAQKKND